VNPYYTLEERLADAVFLADLDEVRALLAEGADPEARDEDDRTPLLAAVAAANAALVAVLLEAGADPNARDADGWTPLHLASQRRDLRIAWLLVHHGADVNAQDDDGNSVLWRAVLGCGGRTEVVELLRRHGARVDLPNALGITAAEVARRAGLALAAGGDARAH
jgi:ankyrin repeat protein